MAPDPTGLATGRPASQARRVTEPARLTVKLAKEDFKFAAAHFTLFPDAPAERLHGHNYRVRIELEGREMGPEGLLAPVAEVKTRIRAICQELDEHTLIPEKSPQLEVTLEGTAVTIRCRGRHYQLPADEVRLLPLPNVTMELLAVHVWNQLAASLAPGRVEVLTVEVEETAGQSCSYRAPLRRA